MNVAAVLSIGTELTLGELIDTNAPWLSERLSLSGFCVQERATVDDDLPRIVASLSRLAAGASVVVVTGGLGPTVDDRTTEAASKAAGVDLVFDPASFDRIREMFQQRGIEMPEMNRNQALFPKGAEILPNAVGTAPGFRMVLGAAQVFFLPGVPREMKPMFEDSVLPAIAAQGSFNETRRRLRTFGMTESGVATKLESLTDEGIRLGYRASYPVIEVKVYADGSSPKVANRRADDAVQRIRELLGDVVFGRGEETLASVVGQHLRQRGLRLGVAESCTGGMIGMMLTENPGSSSYFAADLVSYENKAKTALLGVPEDMLSTYGAVSGPVAGAMAEGTLDRTATDLAVSVTGIAGPGGGSEDKPVGTVWFGLAQRTQPVEVFCRTLTGDRSRIRRMASHIALDLVRRATLLLPR
ncbi:MAG: competence/damage-inducible protein A [Myxococcota bacterium]